MKTNKFTLAICIAIPLIVGGAAGYLTRGGIESFETINKPALSPPGWLFPVVWTILYVLMGIASYLVYTSQTGYRWRIRQALTLYLWQLVFNFFWPIIFFNMQWYFIAFLWLILLWLLIFMTILAFGQISKTAAYLMLPYLVWVTFAGYLNFAIWRLN